MKVDGHIMPSSSHGRGPIGLCMSVMLGVCGVCLLGRPVHKRLLLCAQTARRPVMTAISAHADSPRSCTSVTGKHMPVCMCITAACCSRMGATARCIMWALGGCSPLVCRLLVWCAQQQLEAPHHTMAHTSDQAPSCTVSHTHHTHLHCSGLGSLICCLRCWLLRRAACLWHAKALSMGSGHCCGGHSLRRGCLAE